MKGASGMGLMVMHVVYYALNSHDVFGAVEHVWSWMEQITSFDLGISGFNPSVTFCFFRDASAGLPERGWGDQRPSDEP